MFSHDYQTFPSGVRSPLLGEQKEVVGADQEIIELMRLYRTQRVNGESWDFRYRVFKCVHRLFGPNFIDWLDGQDQNTDISTTMYQFIEDLVGFLNTGKWANPLSTYIILLSHENDHGRDETPTATRRTTKLSDKVKFDEHNYLVTWTSHKDSFDGMLCVVNLLFGAKL